MIRAFVVWGAVLFLSACTNTSLGLCDDDSGCLAGLSCQEGVCVGCGGDSECKAWQACTADRRCELRAGMCETSAQCKSGETCGADNTCVVAARCTSAADCKAWESCTADRRCELRAGMCETNSQCKSGETCGADHTCVLAAGACLSAADCKAHESCNESTKQCVLQAGRCNTANDCDSDSVWAASCGSDNRCHSDEATGNDVLMWGSLLQGTCVYDAISSVLSPARVQVGLGCNLLYTHDAVFDPSGRIHYIDEQTKPTRVKVFVPDPFDVVQGKRAYPHHGYENDPPLPAPGCAADEDVSGFVMQAGTGSIAYVCGRQGTSTTYYDVNGDIVSTGTTLVAWNADNYLLGRNIRFDMFVRSPDGTTLPVQGLPNDWTFLDARAHSTGFRMAISVPLNTGLDRQHQLWRISNDGTASLETVYSDVPDTLTLRAGKALDTTGAFYFEAAWKGRTGFYVDVILRRPADGGPGTIVYSEESAPSPVNAESDFTQLFNFTHVVKLFAGP